MTISEEDVLPMMQLAMSLGLTKVSHCYHIKAITIFFNILATKKFFIVILLILEREIQDIIKMTASGAAGARDVQRVRKARICALQQTCYKVYREDLKCRSD